MKVLVKKIIRKWRSINKQIFFTKEFLEGRNFEIGDYTYGKPKVLHWGEDATLKIGKFCSIADDVKILLGGNHQTHWVTTYPFSSLPRYFPEASGIKGHPATKGDVIIGNDVWIGEGAMILSGVIIGDGAVVAAQALVSKDIGPYEIWGGNPAKLIKKRFSDVIINQLIEEKWWDQPIEKIRGQIGELCSEPKMQRKLDKI